MKLSAIVQEARYIQTTEGVNEAARDFDRLAASQEKAAAAAQVLVKQQDISEKAITRLGSKLDAYTRQHDAIGKAMREVERGEALIAAARSRGLEVSAQTITALENARSKYEKLTGGLNDNAKAAGLNRASWINLSRQLQDVGVSLYGGMSPLTVLAQQGGQIADVFTSSSGGAGAAVKDFGATLLRYALSPITLIGSAVAAAGIGMARWQTQVEALTVSLNGLGRQSGLTVTQLNAIAESAAGKAGVSNATARSLAGQFASAGVSGGSIGGAIDLSRSLSKGLGADIGDIGKELAAALADPARGAEELAKKYGLVTFAQREEIRSIAALGDKAGATAKLIEALNKEIVGMQDPTTAWGRLLEGVAKRISDRFDRLGQELEVSLGGQKSFRDVFDPIRTAAVRAQEAEKSLADERQKELAQLQQDAGLAVASAQARSYAEREAVAMEQARVQTLRQTNDAVKAGIAAEGERGKLLAETARKVQDRAEQATDNSRLVRMSPYERRMAEIGNEARNFRRENIPDFAKPVASAFDFTAKAARVLGDALTETAGKIGKLIPSGEWQGQSSDVLGRARSAIAAIESRGSGGYGAIGPATRSGDRAYGAYQVMGRNIGPWTENALGRRLSIGAFLGSPAAQDAVFNKQFGASLAKYGNTSDAASVWFTGRPMAQGAKRADALGTTGASYVAKFNSIYGADGSKGADVTDLKAMDAQTEAINKANVEFEMLDKWLQTTNADINAQRDALDTQATAFTGTTEQTAFAAKSQELLNQAISQGIPVTDALRNMISSTAFNYADLAKRTEEVADQQQRFRDALDMVRSTASDIGMSLANAFRQGESAGKAMLGVLDRLLSKLLDKSLTMAIDGLFGKMGSANAGSIGGLIGNLFGFADGGVMTGAGPVPLMAYASGGVANRPQLALFGEGSRPEAFVPLPDGRNIPVKLQGKREGGGARVTINNYSTAQVEARQMNDGEIVVLVQSAINANNRRIPGIMADAQRRAM